MLEGDSFKLVHSGFRMIALVLKVKLLLIKAMTYSTYSFDSKDYCGYDLSRLLIS